MQITRINDLVHLATGTNVNWALVTDGDAVTVVDTGYPNDTAALFSSIAAIGRRPGDVEAVLLTHAHLDHMGGVPALRARRHVPVMTGHEEARHARREYLQQITVPEMLRQCVRPRGRRWVGQTLRAVLPHAKVSVADVTGVPTGLPLDIPGRLVAVATPGHTSGHTAWFMPSTGVLFSGDALVTAHPLAGPAVGPRLLPSVFNHDEATMRRSLEAIAGLEADTVVPGHGPEVRGDLDDIVGQALGRAGSS